jgi:hypothetical protein
MRHCRLSVPTQRCCPEGSAFRVQTAKLQLGLVSAPSAHHHPRLALARSPDDDLIRTTLLLVSPALRNTAVITTCAIDRPSCDSFQIRDVRTEPRKQHSRKLKRITTPNRSPRSVSKQTCSPCSGRENPAATAQLFSYRQRWRLTSMHARRYEAEVWTNDSRRAGQPSDVPHQAVMSYTVTSQACGSEETVLP